MKRAKPTETHLILHNIRSTYNVGAIFRTAEAAGVSKIFITGYTPAPLDRFGRLRRDISKVALGAERIVGWEKVKEVAKVIIELKQEGFQIIAGEQSGKAQDYKKIKAKTKVAVIVGNEVRGLSKEVLNKCDLIAEIPMRGKKESLNVSVALGITLFRILNI